MEVVLQENYLSLGYVGDVVKVKGGYARNFLLPRGIAIEASSGNAKRLKHERSVIEAKKVKLKAACVEEAKKYDGLILEFRLRIGEKGKSFGSVSAKDVESALKDKGFALDRRQITLVDQIKAGGDYRVEVKLHAEVIVPVTARVIVEQVEKKIEAAGDAADKKAGKKSRSKKSVSEDETPAGEEPVVASEEVQE